MPHQRDAVMALFGHLSADELQAFIAEQQQQHEQQSGPEASTNTRSPWQQQQADFVHQVMDAHTKHDRLVAAQLLLSCETMDEFLYCFSELFPALPLVYQGAEALPDVRPDLYSIIPRDAIVEGWSLDPAASLTACHLVISSSPADPQHAEAQTQVFVP